MTLFASTTTTVTTTVVTSTESTTVDAPLATLYTVPFGTPTFEVRYGLQDQYFYAYRLAGAGNAFSPANGIGSGDTFTVDYTSPASPGYLTNAWLDQYVYYQSGGDPNPGQINTYATNVAPIRCRVRPVGGLTAQQACRLDCTVDERTDLSTYGLGAHYLCLNQWYQRDIGGCTYFQPYAVYS